MNCSIELDHGLQTGVHEDDPTGIAAVEFLEDILGDGPVMVKTIHSQAEAAGHAKSTIKRAADELGVDKSQFHADGKIKNWKWALPAKTTSDGGAEPADIGPPLF